MHFVHFVISFSDVSCGFLGVSLSPPLAVCILPMAFGVSIRVLHFFVASMARAPLHDFRYGMSSLFPIYVLCLLMSDWDAPCASVCLVVGLVCTVVRFQAVHVVFVCVPKSNRFPKSLVLVGCCWFVVWFGGLVSLLRLRFCLRIWNCCLCGHAFWC